MIRMNAAAELRTSIETASRGWKGVTGHVTASIGVAAVDPIGRRTSITTSTQLMRAAWMALDAAIASGGNCVRSFVARAAA